MAIINLTNQLNQYNFYSDYSADFANYVSHSSTFYRWQTTSGHVVTAIGTGITVFEINEIITPTAGTITSITIDVNNDSPATPDIVITGISVPLIQLANNDGVNESNDFWAVVLDGENTILTNANTTFGGSAFGGGVPNLFPGDFEWGTNDTFSGGNGGNQFYYGDFYNADGANVIGGDDTFNNFYDIIGGDGAGMQNGSTVIGGDDTIIQATSLPADPIAHAHGDVAYVTDSTLIGGDDTITALELATHSIYAYGDFVTVTGAASFVSGGNDVISATQNMDTIYGDGEAIFDVGARIFGGDDTLYGLGNDDTICGDVWNNSGTLSGGDDVIYGGDGNDALYGDWGNNFGIASGGNDILYGGAGTDFIYGNGGNDILVGGEGGDTLNGGTGIDTAAYTGSNAGVNINLATGGAWGGHATWDTLTSIENLTGSAHGDTLAGDANHNTLIGAGGNDTLLGGGGNDTIRGGAGADVLSGGAGFDTLSYADSGAAVQVFLGGNTATGGDATGDTISGFENLVGSNFNDRLYGSAQVNLIDGGAGNDIILGNNGNDTLRGREGRDILCGGNHADTFVYLSLSDSGLLFGVRDRIQDFQNGLDRFDLSALDANTGITGDQAFTYVGSFFTGAAGQVRSYENAGLTFIEGDVNGDGAADFRIELRGTGLGIDASDFIL
ncbi:calcium-binding protein [Zhengella sp. ZM62]|uniref:calcium-binding protein n=1 Tax=Zhengella sedimenti TaxID=3390035 RepID=UPI0039758106